MLPFVQACSFFAVRKRPQKPWRFIRDGEIGGSGIFTSNTSLHCHQQNDCSNVGSCVSHFHFLLIVWAKSQENVHKPQFLKRKESRRGSHEATPAHNICQHSVSQVFTALVLLQVNLLFNNTRKFEILISTYPVINCTSHCTMKHSDREKEKKITFMVNLCFVFSLIQL